MYNKAWVALIMALLMIIEQWVGWNFGMTEEAVTAILALLTPIFVYLIPNSSKS